MFDTIMSIIVLAAIALVAGAFVLWRKGLGKQAMLMLILAMVMVVNVAIWMIPTESGETPAELADQMTGE